MPKYATQVVTAASASVTPVPVATSLPPVSSLQMAAFQGGHMAVAPQMIASAAPVISAAPMMMAARPIMGMAGMPAMLPVAQPQMMMAASPAMMAMARPQFANQGRHHNYYYPPNRR